MSLEVISSSAAPSADRISGFSNGQFKRLDDLYLRAAARKVIAERAVDCDFDDGVACYTYYKAQSRMPYLQFLIRRAGPHSTMFEVYKQGAGRIAKSGLFDRALEVLKNEISKL